MNEIYLLPNLELSNDFYSKNDIVQLYGDFRESGIRCRLLVIDEKALTNIDFLPIINSPETWIVFDQILGNHVKASCPLYLADLNVPAAYVPNFENINNNQIQYWYKNKLMMSVFLNKRGFIEKVNRFVDKIMITDTYDIRGFKLTSEYFFIGADQFFMKKWYSNDGNMVMCAKNGQIVISKNSQHRFDLKYYDDEIDIIREFILKKAVSSNPRFIADTWSRSLKLKETLPRSDFFFVIAHASDISQFDIAKTTYSSFVFFNKSLKDQFLTKYPDNKLAQFCYVFMPYFSEPQLGISNEMMAQNIYWNVGFLTYEEVEKLLNIMLKVIKTDKHVHVIAEVDGIRANFLFQQMQGKVNEVKQLMAKRKNLDKQELLFKLDILGRFSYQTLLPEKQIEQLKSARLYVDTNEISNFALQWHAVAAGIPLFAKQDNDLIKEGKNGSVIHQLDSLFPQISRYIVSMERWNRAVVEDTKIVEQMTKRQAISHWKELI